MGKGGCVDGQLTTTLYGSPIPLIGLYIAAGTLVCLFCMTFDMIYGLTRRKLFLPCTLFPMNSFTMTVLAVATKIPLDLTSPMPRSVDQLSKLTATALMCTSIGFYMPSLGTMGTSERYGNMAALSIMVITMVVNVSIQLYTGVIFEFMVEHIIIMVCILVLLVLMWSSAIAFRTQQEEVDKKRVAVGEGLEGLKSTLRKIYRINYESNPQTLLCRTTHHHAFGILCPVSCILVLEAIPRSFIAPEDMKWHCNGASDYRWSIPIVIVIQFLTIAVGTFSITYRWFSFMWHYGVDALFDYVPYHPEKELVYLKEEPIVLTFVNKSLADMLIATKDIFMVAIIWTQRMLYAFTSCLFGFPLYGWGLPMRDMAEKDMIRWENACERDHRALDQYLIAFIYKWRVDTPSTAAFASASAFEINCRQFVNQFEATTTDYLKTLVGDKLEVDFEYRFSCTTLLVLSGIIEILMPSTYPSKENLMKLSKESFEIIYFVDQNCISTGRALIDQAIWAAAKQLWARWDDHIRRVRKVMSAGGTLQEPYSQSTLRRTCSVDEVDHVRNAVNSIYLHMPRLSPEGRRYHLTTVEFSCLSAFILGSKTFEQDEDLWHFLEECFVRMLSYMLLMLPSAIEKEITADSVAEIDETRVKKASKFFFLVQLLEDTFKWYYWPKKVQSRVNDAHSNPLVVAPLQGYLEGRVSVSDAIVEKVEEEKKEKEEDDDDDDDDGDKIIEIEGSDGFV